MIKNTSKPAKVVVKPAQAKKDSSSSSDSSGIGVGEKENFYMHVVLVQTRQDPVSRQDLRVQLDRNTHCSVISSR